jgi:hypothetical protein
MASYRVVAESMVHSGRRLLVNRHGTGYIQLDQHSVPIAMPDEDFARLCAMRHYRAVTPLHATTGNPESLVGRLAG